MFKLLTCYDLKNSEYIEMQWFISKSNNQPYLDLLSNTEKEQFTLLLVTYEKIELETLLAYSGFWDKGNQDNWEGKEGTEDATGHFIRVHSK